MPFTLIRRSALALAVGTVLAAGCSTPPQPAAEAVAVVPVPPAALPPVVAAPAPVSPVEAEPMAPATQPAFAWMQVTQGPVAAVLSYADKVRPLGGPELQNELARLGEPGDSPSTQMQVALVLAQTRSSADLARAIALLQRVTSSQAPDAQPLQPLARTLAARYSEQRRVEDDRDKQAQQARDSQKRIDQLNDRIEALRAIERSFARPNSASQPQPAASPAPAPGANGARPAQ